MKKIRKFLLLPTDTKKMLIQAFLVVLIIRLGLWLLPFRWINTWIEYFDLEANPDCTADWQTVWNIADSVKASSRFIPHASCLTQAFAVRVLLDLYGQGSDLNIGVNLDSRNTLSAHAWIEVEGKIIIGKIGNIREYSILINRKQEAV